MGMRYGSTFEERGKDPPHITIIALMPNFLADNATPCAWLPALHVTIPFCFCSSLKLPESLTRPRSKCPTIAQITKRISAALSICLGKQQYQKFIWWK